MKINKLIIFSLFFIFTYSLSAQNQEKSPRKSISLNREWRYMRGNHPGAEMNTYNDDSWENIGLPHSFSIPYFLAKDFYTGYGWYRKKLEISEEDIGRRIFLEFDGVFQETEIFVNGKRAGYHFGGYTGFPVDISTFVHTGDNLVAIRVNNVWKADKAPRAGEHVFSGGIYRNVRLVIKSTGCIDWFGTVVTTPELGINNGLSSSVKIKTDIRNYTNRDTEYKLVTQIVDPNGHPTMTTTTIQTVSSYSSGQFIQITDQIKQPELWHPSQPNLYKAISYLYKKDELIDLCETTFGFRWFKWTADRGFFLNGEHFLLIGANVHQDQAGWGDAVTEASIKRDIHMMKEAGFNFIRGSHYPHAPAFSKACDEEGVLFWSEAPFWGIGGFKPDGYWNSSAYPVNEKDRKEFEESALQQLSEMIRIHRNHPSIIAWSMCNEAFFSAPEVMDGVRNLLKKMVKLSRQLDPTRPAAIGGAQRPLGGERIDKLGDVAGYNGDGSTQPDFQNPGIPNMVSEYGSTTTERPGEYMPGWGDLQQNAGWKGFPWRSGQAIWCGFDHGSIAGSALGKMGIVDYFRIPKRSWYWYRNEYKKIAPPEWSPKGIPAKLKLEASQTENVRTDGTDDVQIIITVLDTAGKAISNSPSVTLNVISGPGEFPTGRSITFDSKSDIRIAEGKAAIAFRSYYSGTAIIEASSPGLISGHIKITFNGIFPYQEGITPTVKERPYIRFIQEENKPQTKQIFGHNNPTFASSQQKNHAAGLAADGNAETYWKAMKQDTSPFWTLDTEKCLEIKQIHIVFPQKGIYKYTVDVSDNQSNWHLIADYSENNSEEKENKIVFPDNNIKIQGRFVRIKFQQNTREIPAMLAEIIVEGIVH